MQPERRTERDTDATRPYERAAGGEELVYVIDTDRHDRHIETRGDHPDTTAKRFDVTGRRADSLGKYQDRPAFAGQLTDVLQRLPRARLALRQRKRVEVESRQIVVERVRETLPPGESLRKEVRLEELFGHGG